MLTAATFADYSGCTPRQLHCREADDAVDLQEAMVQLNDASCC